MIAKMLIANRGEIACRIMRTARRMGIATVAVYSDADANALHVRQADEAVRIGSPAASESYLNIDALIDAAIRTGADAVHPGYGFLSENADFAEACHAAGLLFVGPPVAAIRAMGDKAHAKVLMREAGVPVVPGYDGDDQSPEALGVGAQRIGFPLLIKAASGGGGRGMRRVNRVEDIPAALDGARREAESAFGDGRLLLERLVKNARHIEVQVFADSHGNVVHLGERDCSAQRRHQKVLEEAPSPFVDDALRGSMVQAAIKAARAVVYEGAGTIEFIVGADREFHFLEMNTRLQVEHPVTEMVTGLDLVEWQLRVAAGEPLPLQQEQISFSGHAVEARVCAEDAYSGFVPQTGTVLRWLPAESDGLRIDHGLVEGEVVSPFYDPMIAKVIVLGATRAEAISRLKRGLLATQLLGVVTNRAFLLDLLESEVFRDGNATTNWIEQAGFSGEAPGDEDFATAAALLALADGDDWFSSTGARRWPLTLQAGEETRHCIVRFEREKLAGVDVDGREFLPDRLNLAILFAREGRCLWLDRNGRAFRFEEPDLLQSSRNAGDDGVVVSPVSGLLRQIRVAEGDAVRRGDVVALVEAMKMETQLTAGRDGKISGLRLREGVQVRSGDVLFEISEAE